MMLITATNDMKNRYEQNTLVCSTMKHFEYDMSTVTLKEMHGKHCQYVCEAGENGEAILVNMVCDYIKSFWN